MIPADGIMVACNDLLEVDQSSITGIAIPVSKNDNGRCFWNTGVVIGEAFLQVEHTGSKTFIGRAVKLIHGGNGTARSDKELASHKEYLKVVRPIGIFLLVMLALPGFLWQTSVLSIKSWAEIISIIADMAIVAGRFFSRATISSIRATSRAKLSETGCNSQTIEALETLAGIDTICVDNSGIITENRYILVKPYCVSCDPETIILAASLSINENNSHDALHRAIARTLRQLPQAKARRDQYRIIDNQDNTRQGYTQAMAEAKDGTRMFFAGGHPYAILKLCQKSAPADHKNGDKALVQAVKTFRDQGLGSLGLAQRHERGNWEFLGVLPFLEPPRQDTRLAFKLAAKLGVRVKVMSSWHEALVERSARVAGIEGPLLRADVIDEFQRDQSNELATHIKEVDVYTELNDKHRELILEILQDSGHRVAITGSGTSHIPAFRKADFGIAIAAATDEVNRSATAELICTKEAHGLLPSINAIRLARQAYQLAHNHIVRHTVRTLHVLFTMLFVFLTEGKLLDLRLLLMSSNVIEVIEGAEALFGREVVNTPFQRKPTRWSIKKMLKQIVSLVVVVISGTYFCANSLPSAERLQMLSFLLATGDVWIVALMQMDDYGWCSRRTLGLQLAAHLLITAVCVTGWMGDSLSVSLKTAFQVWLYGLGTFATVGAASLSSSIVINHLL